MNLPACTASVPKSKELTVFGAGGHAKVVIETAVLSGFRIVMIVDQDRGKRGMSFLGYTVAHESDLQDGSQSPLNILIAIGNNQTRKTTALKLANQGHFFSIVCHTHSIVSPSARICVGSILLPGSIVNSNTQIGEHVIINTAASVDHDCVIGAYSHIAPGVRICGGVKVGMEVLVGAGSILIPGITVGDGAIIGAGSVVVRDVPPYTTVVGNPACRLPSSNG